MFIHLRLMRSKIQCSYNFTTLGFLLYIGSLLLYPKDRGCTSVRNVSIYLRNMTSRPVKNLLHISRPENLKSYVVNLGRFRTPIESFLPVCSDSRKKILAVRFSYMKYCVRYSILRKYLGR